MVWDNYVEYLKSEDWCERHGNKDDMKGYGDYGA